MEKNKEFRVEIVGTRKAQIFQGDFNWGEIEIPQESWDNLIIGLKHMILLSESESIPGPEPNPDPFPTGPPPKPDPPDCHGPFCPDGTPFSSIEKLRQFLEGPLVNPGRPDLTDFKFKNENIISIDKNIMTDMLNAYKL